MNEYPEDEFDRLAAERETHGAHRRPGRRHAWLIALVAVVILAPLLGIVFGETYSSRNEATPAAEATQTPTEGAEETSSPSADASEDAPADGAESQATPSESEPAETDDPSEEETTEEPEAVAYDSQVLLLNGRGQAGFAAENQAVLEAANYTNVAAADYAGGSNPAQTTVYYANADLAATASDIAAQLGAVDQVESAQAVAGNDIVVVLR